MEPFAEPRDTRKLTDRPPSCAKGEGFPVKSRGVTARTIDTLAEIAAELGRLYGEGAEEIT
ncbi:MAG: hypothetical protein NVS4B6_09200 [Mycobacterium sp.]